MRHRKSIDFAALGQQAERQRDRSVATLAEFARQSDWLWGHCRNVHGCGLRRPIRVQTFIDRWGPHAPASIIRTRSRCSRCGGLGIDTTLPSWGGMSGKAVAFPEDWIDPPRPTSRHLTDFAAAKADQIDW